MTKVAVVLSGCGVYDGSEIHESVLTLLALERVGAEVTCIAPEISQRHVIDHSTGEIMDDEDRNVLQESARISRGEIMPLDQVRAEQFDAFIYVGGFGVAKNLSSFAFDGDAYDVDAATVSLIQSAHESSIPQGFMCIAPVLAACALGQHHVKLTVGNDKATAQSIEVKGAEHVECAVGAIIIDAKNKVVSTPAYMLATTILEAESGINQLVKSIVKMARKNVN
jgi:enhancing lycopene biosynthesis protein 2